MASYSVNPEGVAKARALIDARQYVLDSRWGDVQPTADEENSFLDSHTWEDYQASHLGLTDGATDGGRSQTVSPSDKDLAKR